MCHIQILQVSRVARADANWKGGQVMTGWSFRFQIRRFTVFRTCCTKLSREICILSERHKRQPNCVINNSCSEAYWGKCAKTLSALQPFLVVNTHSEGIWKNLSCWWYGVHRVPNLLNFRLQLDDGGTGFMGVRQYPGLNNVERCWTLAGLLAELLKAWHAWTYHSLSPIYCHHLIITYHLPISFLSISTDLSISINIY